MNDLMYQKKQQLERTTKTIRTIGIEDIKRNIGTEKQRVCRIWKIYKRFIGFAKSPKRYYNQSRRRNKCR